jgi:subtilisin family serine protease
LIVRNAIRRLLSAAVCASILLLSLASSPLAQNAAIAREEFSKDIKDKNKAPKYKHPKIESSLLQAKEKKEQQAQTQGRGLEEIEEPIRVIFELDNNDNLSGKINTVKNKVVEVEITYENLIQALILPSRLDELANLMFVNLISEPVLPVPLAISEDASLIGVDIINADGNKGAGVKVAVIDAGFDIANPEISPNIVEAISFRADLGTW